MDIYGKQLIRFIYTRTGDATNDRHKSNEKLRNSAHRINLIRLLQLLARIIRRLHTHELT